MLALGKFSLLVAIQSRCSGGRPYWWGPESGTLTLKGPCIVLSLGTPSKGQLLIQWLLHLSATLAIGEKPQVTSGRAPRGGKLLRYAGDRGNLFPFGSLVRKHIKDKFSNVASN
jgi:hypothetical protein